MKIEHFGSENIFLWLIDCLIDYEKFVYKHSETIE